jgi:hypothetical protein
MRYHRLFLRQHYFLAQSHHEQSHSRRGPFPFQNGSILDSAREIEQRIQSTEKKDASEPMALPDRRAT